MAQYKRDIAKPQTDWQWVKNQAAKNAPIPYDPSDPDDGPYDPNDDETVERHLSEGNRVLTNIPAPLKKPARAS